MPVISVARREKYVTSPSGSVANTPSMDPSLMARKRCSAACSVCSTRLRAVMSWDSGTRKITCPTASRIGVRKKLK
jgi:hypothetical protein